MTNERLDEIIKGTAYPESNSVHQAIYQVENEMQQEFNSRVCENCLYSDDVYCYNSYALEGLGGKPVPKDFGCNQWEDRGDE